MNNVMEASKVTKEIQLMNGRKSESPKGDFETLFKVESDTLKTDMTEETKKAFNGLGIDLDEVKDPTQEGGLIDEEFKENEGLVSPLSYLIQGNPPLQIMKSAPGLNSLADPEQVGELLTPAGSLKIKDSPEIPLMKQPQEAEESMNTEVTSALKTEISVPVQLQKGLPQELKESIAGITSKDLVETKLIGVLPEKESKSEATIAHENKLKLEQQKIDGNTVESKGLPKIEESLEKSNLSYSFGEDKENDTSSGMQKKAQPDRIENFPSDIKASEFQKPQIPSSPEVTKVSGENLEMATKEILHQMETLTEGNKTMVKVKLNPEELGEMEISLSMEEGRLTGKIIVGNKEIQQIFTDKLHELNQTLKENRIDVASFEVKLSSDQNLNQDHARHQGQRPADYSNRFKSNRNVSLQTEEWMRTDNRSHSGIDLLA
ncbi:MAG: flagellar hook-length control protein FliK [Clostridiaceae bacterium]